MNGLILEIGIIILKQLKKSNILIVGYGSIGKKYHNSASKFFKRKEIHIFSKHLKKDSLKNIKNIKNIKNLDYIILSNRAPDRIKFFKSLIKKKATYIFEKPISTEYFTKSQKKNFFNLIKKNKITIKTGYCLRLNPAVIKLKKFLKNKLNKIISIKMNTSTNLPTWRKGDYTKKHNHAPTYQRTVLSGCYYAHVEEGASPIVFEGEEPIYPENDTLIIFSSNLYHEVPPTDAERIVMSFNSIQNNMPEFNPSNLKNLENLLRNDQDLSSVQNML